MSRASWASEDRPSARRTRHLIRTQRSPEESAARLSVGQCGFCAKKLYATRRDAKRAARILFPADHPSAYPCGQHWHWGHLPVAVLQGLHGRYSTRNPVL